MCYNKSMITDFAKRAARHLETEQNRNEIQRFVEIYLAMMELLSCGDISENAEFHRLYNVFYKLRFSGSNHHTSGEVYAAYYRLLETYKHDAGKPEIECVLKQLWDLTGKVHLSFSSKLIGTLYPDSAPIWDSNVRILLEIPYGAGDGCDRLTLAAEAYHALEARYRAFFATQEADAVTALFDAAFPAGREIAAWKKVDFLLWRMGSKRSRATASNEL